MTVLEEKYFKTPELTHRQELILHLLEYSNHLIVIQGEKDAGKTSLFNELNSASDSGLILRKLTTTTQTNESDLLNTILDETGTNVSFDEYQNWLSRCRTKQQIPALIIDDVDNLTDEMLAFLFNKISSIADEVVLHVCLFCEPAFLDNKRVGYLESEENRSLHIIEMPKFNEKQTVQYLQQAYPENDSTIKILDEKTIQQIHRISNGLPGRIIELAEQYLNDPAEQKPRATTFNLGPLFTTLHKNRTIIIVVLLLVVLSVTITLLLHQTEKPPVKEEIQIALPPKEVNDQKLVNLPEPVLQEEIIEPETEPEPTDIEELTPPVIPELAADVELGRVEKNKKIEIFEDASVPPVQITSEPDIKTSEATDETVVKVQEEEIQDAVDISENDEPVLAEQSRESKPQEEEKKRDVVWLLNQKPNDYVIQLIGAKEQATINVYLNKLKGERDNIIQIDTTNNGEAWHILIYGHYQSRLQAVTAIEKLPDAAKKLSPWPRTVKSLKQLDIKN